MGPANLSASPTMMQEKLPIKEATEGKMKELINDNERGFHVSEYDNALKGYVSIFFGFDKNIADDTIDKLADAIEDSLQYFYKNRYIDERSTTKKPKIFREAVAIYIREQKKAGREGTIDIFVTSKEEEHTCVGSVNVFKSVRCWLDKILSKSEILLNDRFDNTSIMLFRMDAEKAVKKHLG